MSPSPACAALVKQFEGCRLEAFLPTPDDVPTIGYGHTRDVTLGMTWTQEQADAALAFDLANFGAGVDQLISSPTTQSEFDAMTSFAYNVGLTAFEDSTLLRLHNQGDYVDVPAQFGRWVHQGAQILNGLVARRKAEAALYQSERP